MQERRQLDGSSDPDKQREIEPGGATGVACRCEVEAFC